MPTRCKFQCQSVTKTASGPRNDPEMLYTAEFHAVTSGSKENEKFFRWTPSGILRLGTYKDDLFQPGKSYYLDISEAES